MTTTRISISLVIAWLAQTTLVPVVAGTGAPVDLVLLVVVFAAIARGPVVGLWAGTVGGFVQDVLSGGIVGISGLTKSIVAVLVGVTGSRFIIATAWHRMLVVLVASIVHAVCFLVVYSLVGTAVPATGMGFVLVQGLANATLGVVAERSVRLAPGVFRRIRQGSSPVARRHWIMG